MAITIPQGYRSDTEYCFDEEHADAITRIAAYHRKDYSLSVIWFSPLEHAKIRQSIATPFQRDANDGLGALDRLPLELLYETLFQLDVYSLFKFRQVNLRSRQMIDSLKQYRMIVSHALNLLCALLRTRLATDISILDFYNALCTKPCTLCGEFAGFISILAWKRCCFKCLQEAPETQMQTLAATRKQLHLTKAESNRLRSFKALPGIYSMSEYVQNSRVAIVSVPQAISVCGRLPHGPAQTQFSNSQRNQKFNFMGACALPYYDKQTGEIEHGMSCAGCQLALEKKIIATRAEDWAFEARDKVYARDGFLEHFKSCKQAQLLWKSSDEGKHMPTELPEAARRGGFFSERLTRTQDC